MSDTPIWQTANISQILQFLEYAETFPNYPKNFIPPPFLDKNYVAPYRGTRIIVVAVVMTVLALIFVVARLWVRRTTGLRTWGADDWVIIPAMACTIGFTVIQVLGTKIGCAGRHVYDCSFHALNYSFLVGYVGLMVYLVTAQLIKISILLFIYRLCPPGDKLLRWLIYATHAVVVISMLGCMLMTTFQCTPISATWDLNTRIAGGFKCYAEWASLTAWAIIYALTDVWLILLPMRLISQLQLPRATRYGILFVFACGAVSTIASIVKAATIKYSYDNYDVSWVFGTVLISSHLELTFGLMVASLPALNLYLVRMAPAIWGLSGAKSTSRSSRPSVFPSKSKSYTETNTSSNRRPQLDTAYFTDEKTDFISRTYAPNEQRMSQWGLPETEKEHASDNGMDDSDMEMDNKSEISLELIVQRPESALVRD